MQPTALFRGCPDLDQWQVDGFRRLSSAPVPESRINDLALIWALQLEQCRNEALEEWYLAQLDDAIRRGEWHRTLRLRTPIFRFDIPATRSYVRSRMLDETLPVEVRSTMGSFYFERFQGEQLLGEFMQAFEAMQLPEMLAWAQAGRLLEWNADRTLAALAQVIRVDPRKADQAGLATVVEASARYASARARAALADAIQSGLDAGGNQLGVTLRERLMADVRSLRTATGLEQL